MKRRDFISKNGLLLGGLAFAPINAFSLPTDFSEKVFVSNRPMPEERTFKSLEVEKTIEEVKASIADKELAWLFENCYPNTLDTKQTYPLQD